MVMWFPVIHVIIMIVIIIFVITAKGRRIFLGYQSIHIRELIFLRVVHGMCIVKVWDSGKRSVNQLHSVIRNKNINLSASRLRLVHQKLQWMASIESHNA